MSGYQKNPWVTFLRQYGPVASNDAMFDEHVLRAARRNGVAPLRFDSGGLLEEIIQNFQGDTPKSVILTGTAGDGKTWLCREVWDALGGEISAWSSDDKVRRLVLVGGATLVVLKDLSELKAEDKLTHLTAMASSVTGATPREVFLMAANDGQLREAWERVSSQSPLLSTAAKIVEDLLVQGQFRTQAQSLTLFNLSRQDSARLMARVIDALLAHPGWSGCQGCEGALEGDLRCPAQVNLERLRQPLFRARLTDLLTLCDQSGFHLPVRQLLVLASNLLLGHPDGKDHMLRCQDVEKVVREDKVHLASIYRSAFGENLTEHRREGNPVFEALRRFGIGDETSNRIDNLLVYGHDDPELQTEFQALFGNDREYGANKRFSESLCAYLEGREVAPELAFPAAAVAQRQRLFFTIPQERAEALGLWELTVFRHGGEFLDRVLRPMERDRNVRVRDAVLLPMVRGLNRVFTGRLTDDHDALWLASSGSHSQARVCRVHEFHIAVRDTLRGEGVSVRRTEDGRPELVVSLAPGLEETLPLHLVRFEFLLRVAAGALPSNFSRECYEDILSFKSRILRRLRSRPGWGSQGFNLEILTLSDAGALASRRLTIAVEEPQ